jgi:hypothetical protein
MRATFATEAGSPDRTTEDWVLVSSDLAVVLDGATARTDTGCVHGVAWYSHQLGAAIVANAAVRASNLAGGVAHAIDQVARLHPQCDLSHPGTPSAAVGVVRAAGTILEYLVLGDVTVAIQTTTGMTVVTDDRVSHTAQPARTEAERLPIGSPEKAAALLEMKHGELAVRNKPGGYWVAANNPGAIEHAYTGQLHLDQVRGVAILTDGAARAIAPFDLCDWPSALTLLEDSGPAELLRQVRDAEASDPTGLRWPRNKRSDDATAVYLNRIDPQPSGD